MLTEIIATNIPANLHFDAGVAIGIIIGSLITVGIMVIYHKCTG